MRSRVVRSLLFLLVVLAFAGGSYNVYLLEQRGAATRSAARAFEDEARGVGLAIAELKAGQFAYVATGQGASFWIGKSTALTSNLTSRIQRLQQAALSPETGVELGGALDAVASARQADARVQDHLQNGQQALASDVIFGDLRKANDTAAARVVAAIESERAAADAAIEVTRRTQLATAAGCALFALLVLLLLLPSAPAAAGPEPAEADTLLSLRETRILPVIEQSAGKAAPKQGIDLSAAAALCNDFARLRETSELPALLERFAHLINAGGIIVWIDDPAGKDLRAAVAHGYSSQALARMRGISKDADNATACAYRQRALQVVEGTAGTNGAIAVPLVTPDGCAGVMAAELPDGGERRTETLAVATIVAAQLATLVTPQSEGEQ
jgi:hypothetical protein